MWALEAAQQPGLFPIKTSLAMHLLYGHAVGFVAARSSSLKSSFDLIWRCNLEDRGHPLSQCSSVTVSRGSSLAEFNEIADRMWLIVFPGKTATMRWPFS